MLSQGSGKGADTGRSLETTPEVDWIPALLGDISKGDPTPIA